VRSSEGAGQWVNERRRIGQAHAHHPQCDGTISGPFRLRGIGAISQPMRQALALLVSYAGGMR
jgi:hypothetical protein